MLFKKSKMYLQDFVPCSESIFWKNLQNQYTKRGINAWAKDQTPYYATSNIHIANQYAWMIVNYLLDLQTTNHLDNSKPLVILELAAGSGKFSFYTLKALFSIMASKNLNHPITYIMSDCAENNIVFWMQHPAFKTWIDEGIIEFAHIDITQQQSLTTYQGKPIDCLSNPPIVIANYLFDSVGTDLFYIAKNTSDVVDIQSVDMACYHQKKSQTLAYDFKQRSINLEDYDDEVFTSLLQYYAKKCHHKLILMPTVALRFLSHFAKLCHHRFMLICTDKGFINTTQIAEHSTLDFKSVFIDHETVKSTQVNFHALSYWFEQHAGQSHILSARPVNLRTLALTCHPKISQYSHLQSYIAHGRSIQLDDAIRLLDLVSQASIINHLKLSDLLLILNLSGNDPGALQYLFKPFMTCMKQTNTQEIIDYGIDLMKKVQDNFYFVPDDDQDIWFFTGYYFQNYGFWHLAQQAYNRSMRDFGPSYPTLFNLGMCAHHLHDDAQALTYFKLALQKDNKAQACIDMIKQLKV